MELRLAEPELEKLQITQLPRRIVAETGEDTVREQVAVLVDKQLATPVDVDQRADDVRCSPAFGSLTLVEKVEIHLFYYKN